MIDGFEIAAYEKSVAADVDIAGQGFARGGSADVVSLLSDPEPVSSADLRLNAHIRPGRSAGRRESAALPRVIQPMFCRRHSCPSVPR